MGLAARTVQALPMFFSPAHVAWATGLEDRIRCLGLAKERVSDVGPSLGRAGFFGALLPVRFGGESFSADSVSVRALCLTREELAYHSPLADAVFAVQGLGTYPRVLVQDDAASLQMYLAGERIAGFALTEPEAGSDVASLTTRAEHICGEWRLHGHKWLISNVGIADSFVVFANADPAQGKKGISAFVVQRTDPGLELRAQRTGSDHPLGELILSNARGRLLGAVGVGLRLALGTLDVFRTSVGAAAVGMAQRAFDEAAQFVTSRVQFKQRLSDFQMVQAKVAEMAIDLEASRLLVYRAAWAKDAGQSAPAEVAMAKMHATEAAQRVIDSAVQLLGGRGVLEDGVVAKLYRDIRPLRIYEGTTEIQKLIIASHLLPKQPLEGV